jgi:tRNA (5-methylaminomethyl-2-thiouridylate)-methyltransferase
MKIAVLVSGGVDSSLALKLLRDQGHNLTAFYLKIWLEDELAYLGDCPWEEDLKYVRAVCDQLGVPLEVVNFQKEYWDSVVAYALREIKAGRTPNPDIMCNKEIKFGAFADRYGHQFDKVATGHYAQIAEVAGNYYLRLAPDPIKDQTYFLARLSQAQLQKAMFPIGHLTKAQVRELAHAYDLPNKARKDSQGICFLGTIKFSDFLKHHFGTQTGNLVEAETGAVMGTHPGFFYFTPGQRQGIGLSGGPWYVVRKDSGTNTVYISRHYYDGTQQRNEFAIEEVDFVQHPDAQQRTQLKVKLRHGPHMHACSVEMHDATATVQLQDNDQGIASGQFAVFYSGDLCIGSGKIR